MCEIDPRCKRISDNSIHSHLQKTTKHTHRLTTLGHFPQSLIRAEAERPKSGNYFVETVFNCPLLSSSAKSSLDTKLNTTATTTELPIVGLKITCIRKCLYTSIVALMRKYVSFPEFRFIIFRKRIYV